MKKAICRSLACLLVLTALASVLLALPIAAGGSDPVYAFNCSADWVSSMTEGTDYTGVFFGEGGDLQDYYFIKFNQATLGKNFVYIGDYDLSRVDMISFDVTNGGESKFHANSRLVLAADKGGETELCSFPAIAGTGWSNPVTSSAMVDSDYSGPLYAIFYNDGATDGYQVDHFRFWAASEGGDGNETGAPETLPDDGHSLPLLYRFVASTPWLLSLDTSQAFGVLCGTSGIDKDTQYLKFNQATLETSFAYIGDYDLSRVGAVSYLVTNGGTSAFKADTALLFAADPAGDRILVKSKAISAVGWDTPRTVLEFVESDYNGPLYLVFRNAGATDGYQVADFRFYGKSTSSDGGDIEILPPETQVATEAPPATTTPESEESAPDTLIESVSETVSKPTTNAFSETLSADEGGCSSALSAGVLTLISFGGAVLLGRKRRVSALLCALLLCTAGLLFFAGCQGNGTPSEGESVSETSAESAPLTESTPDTADTADAETEEGAETVLPQNSLELLTFTPASPEGQVLTANGASPQILIRNYNESAIDALGRPLPTSEEAGLPREGKYVGLFYFLWASEGGTVQTNTNVTEILACNPDNPTYGSIGHFCWWAQPETGYRRSNDEWVIRRDMYYFSMAGVDFIYLDFTNGYLYENGLTALLDTCLAMRAEGQMTPYIVPWAHGTRESEVGDMGDLYEKFYKNEKYNDLWFHWDGKPLAIIRHDLNDKFPILEDPEMTDFFTFRIGWSDRSWPDKPQGYGKWDDNHIVNYGYTYGWWDSADRAECAAIGTAGFANYGSGRSGELSLERYVDKFGCSPTMGNGLVLEKAFRQVMKRNPETEVLLLSRWNESGAQYYDVNDFGFVDQFSPEFSRDMEPVKGLFGDNYFYQMCSIIRRFKGVLPPDGNTGRVTVDIAGDFAPWQSVAPVFTDFAGDTAVRDCYDTTGTVRYVNKTGRNDIVESRMTADDGSLYVYARTAAPITSPEGEGNWMLLFLDTDNDHSTGFEGYDVLINNRVIDRDVTSLSVWRDNVWQEIGAVAYKVVGDELMLSLPRAQIGLTDADLTVNFHWLDNVSDLYDLDSWFTTGDSAPERRNNYTLSLAVPYDASAKTDAVEMVPEDRYTYMPAVTPENTDELEAGLTMTYYLLPDDYGIQPTFDFIDRLAAVTTRVEDIHASYGIRYADYALLFEGYLKADANGTYDFTVICDDGARLYIDGRLVVDGAYVKDTDTTGTARTHLGSLRLAEGYHTVRIEYAECVGNGGAYLTVTCAQEIEWVS